MREKQKQNEPQINTDKHRFFFSRLCPTVFICGYYFLFAFAGSANAQVVGGGGVVAYDPEISTVSSGEVIDVSAVVSYDRKYVTLTFGGQSSRVIAIHQFPVIQNANEGFVGGAMPTGVVPAGAPVALNSPAAIERRATALRSVLSHEGMFLLASTK